MKRFDARAFEHTTPGRPAASEVEPRADVRLARQFYYERLMQVSIRHDFYNASRDECPDFDITPTPATAALMHDLGLIFRYERTGFSVLLDEMRKDILFEYLARQEEPPAAPPSKGGCWSRLSFVLALNNPYFVNFTHVPVNLHPTERNFYFTNQEAHHGEGGRVILTPGERVDGADLLPVVSTQLALSLPPTVERVLVLDISGDIVIDQAACPQASPPARGAQDDEACVVYLDFSPLPEDRYTVELVKGGAGGAPSQDAPPLPGVDVLYTAAAPVPLCFIDLLFTDPTGSGPGIYPVQGLLSESPEVVPVQYELRFETRSTYWNYFVVPQPQAEPFEELRIESLSLPPVEFVGPCRVTLANGARAYMFGSTETLALRQQSEYHFRLLGRHGLMTHVGVLVERLPVASMRQVLPLSAEDACARLRQSLLPGAEAEACCRRLVGLSCPAPETAREPGGAGEGERAPATNIYSDTYVHV